MEYVVRTTLNLTVFTFQGALLAESENKLPLFLLEAIGEGATLKVLKDRIFGTLNESRIRIYLDILAKDLGFIKSNKYDEDYFELTDTGRQVLKRGKSYEPLKGEYWEVLLNQDIDAQYLILDYHQKTADRLKLGYRFDKPYTAGSISTSPPMYIGKTEDTLFSQSVICAVGAGALAQVDAIPCTIADGKLTAEYKGARYKTPLFDETLEIFLLEIKQQIDWSEEDNCYIPDLEEAQELKDLPSLIKREKKHEISCAMDFSCLSKETKRGCEVELTLNIAPCAETSAVFFFALLNDRITGYLTEEETAKVCDEVNSELSRYSQYELQICSTETILEQIEDHKKRYIETALELPLEGF